MAKKIFPGNYVNRPSSYQGQGIVCLPGRVYHHVTGYALVDSTGGVEFDVVIPSPDRRADDKPRADITGLVIPSGSVVYHLGLRVPDMRKDRGIGTADSGLSGTATDTIKLATAIGDDATIASGALSTDSSLVPVAVGGSVVPVGTVYSDLTGVAVVGDQTLKVFVADTSGTSAGSTLTSTAVGGTPIIVEVAYWAEDTVADLGDVTLPFLSETT